MTVKNRPRIIFAALVLLGAGLAAGARLTLDDYLLSILNFAGIHIILAVSLNITNGFTGLFSLGHPGFMAIGGYVTAVLTFPVARKSMFLTLPPWLAGLELPFFPALIAGGACAAATAAVVGLPVLRLRGHYLAVATMGFLIIVQVLILNWDSVTRGALGLNGLPGFTTLWWVYPWVVFTVYTGWKLKFSSLGRGMNAVREDETAAGCLGINPFKTRVAALVIGAFFAGVAGGLWAHLVTAITPSSFSLILAFNIVVMVVAGGTGSVTGSVIAATCFTLFTEVFRSLEEALGVYGIDNVIMALILILVLVFRPQGLLGSREPGFLDPSANNKA